MAGRALAGGVSARKPYVFSDAGSARVAVVDYGCKRSILQRLAWAGAAVTVFPHDATADELARRSGLGAAELAAQLAALELDGLTSEADAIYRASAP